MNIVYFRVCNNSSIEHQQDELLAYLDTKKIHIDKKIIEVSSKPKNMDDRDELKEILNTIESDDNLVIYHLKTLSLEVGELLHILSILLKKSIKVHISKLNKTISKNTTAIDLLEHINSIHYEIELSENKKEIGRPKGILSKSKFDCDVTAIVLMLKEGFSVSEIARRLNVSRSSLKDYINSRNLKRLAVRFNCTK